MSSPLEEHGHAALLAIVKDVLTHPSAKSKHPHAGLDDISVEGWERLLGRLGLTYDLHPPEMLNGMMLVKATVPSPYGDTTDGWALGPITPDTRDPHIELSKLGSFAFRRSMRTAWLALALEAGVDVAVETDQTGAATATKSAAKPAAAKQPAKPPPAKPPQRQQAKPAPKPDSDDPQAQLIYQQTVIRRSKVGQGKSEAELAEWDAAVAAKHNFVWAEDAQTYQPFEEE